DADLVVVKHGGALRVEQQVLSIANAAPEAHAFAHSQVLKIFAAQYGAYFLGHLRVKPGTACYDIAQGRQVVVGQLWEFHPPYEQGRGRRHDGDLFLLDRIKDGLCFRSRDKDDLGPSVETAQKAGAGEGEIVADRDCYAEDRFFGDRADIADRLEIETVVVVRPRDDLGH